MSDTVLDKSHYQHMVPRTADKIKLANLKKKNNLQKKKKKNIHIRHKCHIKSV